jgi:hypothetical protein
MSAKINDINSLKFKYVWDAQRKKAYFTNVGTNKMVWKLPDIIGEGSKKEEKETIEKKRSEDEQVQKKEEEDRQKKEQELKLQKEQEELRKQEEEKKKKENEEKRKIEEAEEKKHKEEEEKKRAEEKKIAAEEEKKRKEEEKKKKEEDLKKKREEDKKKREEDERKKQQQEEELRKKQEAIKNKREEEERKKIEDEERKIRDKEEQERAKKEAEERRIREEQERIENEKLEKERAEAEKIRLEQERIENERLEKERIEREKLDKERFERERILEQERSEKERIAREEEERKQKIEHERLEKERLERERRELERLEKERLEKERVERQRLEKERVTKERAEQRERDRLEKERLEAEKKQKELERKDKEKKKKEEIKLKLEEEKRTREEKVQHNLEEQERVRQEKEDALRKKIEEKRQMEEMQRAQKSPSSPSTPPPKPRKPIEHVQATPPPRVPPIQQLLPTYQSPAPNDRSYEEELRMSEKRERKKAERLRQVSTPLLVKNTQPKKASSKSEQKLLDWIEQETAPKPWDITRVMLVKLLSEHFQTVDSIDALQQLITPRTQEQLKTPLRRLVLPSPHTNSTVYNEEEDKEGENIVHIRRGNRRILKAATLYKLIEKVTSADLDHDREFVEAFFLTYRCFTNPEAVFDLFLQRYEQVRGWPDEKESMQDVLMLWWQLCFQVDWLPNQRMMLSIGKLLDMSRKEGDRDFVNQFLKLIDLEVQRNPQDKKSATDLTVLSNVQSQRCMSVLERPSPLFSIDTSLLAKQLTLIDAKLLCNIRYPEFLHPEVFAHYFDQQNKFANAFNLRAPNILQMLSLYDALVQWTASAIVSPATAESRAQRMTLFIKTAYTLTEMNNHHTAMAIIQGIQSESVMRLRLTRKLLTSQTEKMLVYIIQFRTIHERMDREVVLMQLLDDYIIPEHVTPVTPYLPYLHPFLKRLTIVGDAYLPRIKVTSEQLIHMDKYVQMSRSMNLLRQYQITCNFGFEWDDNVHTKIQKSMVYRQPENVLIQWSHKRE